MRNARLAVSSDMPRATSLAWHAFALAISLAACGHHDTGPAPSPSAPPPDGQALVAFGDAALAEIDASAPSYPWADAVRLERWEDAWRGLDVLSEAEKKKPEIRYARARVAIARADPKAAIALLDGLEKDIPLLEGDFARRRADARYDTGDYQEAGEYFASRGTPGGWLRASDAFEKANEVARSRAACDKVLASDKKTRTQEAEARARRLRLGDRPAADEIADARWLALEAPDLKAAKDAEAKLARLDAAHPLTVDDRMKRSRALVSAGMTDDAIREIDRAASAPGHAPPVIERKRARAEALFKARGRGLDAARAYDECVAVGGARAQEDAFHAARALSRADHDDEAIERYARVVRRSPRTTWAEQATFLAARLHLLHGHWAKAVLAFDAYAKDFPSGSDRREAARDRALAHLVAKDYKGARKLFEQLADDPSDSLESARAGTMAALAALKDGDTTHAIARWTDVARTRPLTWPALVARTRLAQAHAPLPPPIDVDSPSSPLAPPIAVALPPPVDLLHRVGLDADAETFLREREPLITGAAGGRGVEALCGAYGQLGRAKRRYQIAQQTPFALLTTAPSPRNQWAWDCVYPAPYVDQVRAEEDASHLPRGVVYGVMRQESGFDPEAVSSARAVGLMQLLPDTAKTFATAQAIPHDEGWLTRPPHNIALGARYLKELVDKLHGQVPLAIAAYNAGPEAIQRWTSRMKSIDLDVFVELIPFAETRVYVARVTGNWARYAFAAGPPATLPELTLDIEP